MMLIPPVILPEQREKLAEAIEEEGLLQEVLWLWAKEDSTPEDVGHFGGWPSLPENLRWPVSPKTKEPVHFLFQVDLARLPDFSNPHRALLPRRGLLLVFAGLTFKYVECVTGDCPGLISMIYLPNGQQGDALRQPPANLPSPFKDPDAWMPLNDRDATPPEDGSIPPSPMGALVMPELLSPKPGSAILDSEELGHCYAALQENLADNEAEQAEHARQMSGGQLMRLDQTNVIRLFNSVLLYENATDLSEEMTDPVRLFTFQLPPHCSVWAGEPRIEVLFEHDDLQGLRLETARVNLDIS